MIHACIVQHTAHLPSHLLVVHFCAHYHRHLHRQMVHLIFFLLLRRFQYILWKVSYLKEKLLYRTLLDNLFLSADTFSFENLAILFIRSSHLFRSVTVLLGLPASGLG